MDSLRHLLIIALLFLSFLIFQQWQLEYGSLKIPTAVSTTETIITDRPHHQNDLPTAPTPPLQACVTVENDVLALTIDTRGGDIVAADLLTYPQSLQRSMPLRLLESTPDFTYQAQSGLIGPHGPDNPAYTQRPNYQAQKKQYILGPTESQIQVPLIYRDPHGGCFTKIFTLKRGEYTVAVSYQIDNLMNQPMEVQFFGQLKQTIQLPKERNKRSFTTHAYRGVAYSTPAHRYKKYSFNEIKKADLAQPSQGGWVAMLQHYFATAWIPSAAQPCQFYTKQIPTTRQAIVGFKGETVTIAPGEKKQLHATLWIGPELQEKMAAVAKYLDLTVDYGWLWFISQPLFKLLKFLHRLVENWGVSIVLITFIVRGFMYPLTKAQYTSMAKMRTLQPKLLALRERLGNEQQRLSQETIALYKKEGVNPLGGCLPILVQMPIFLALYWMLMGSIELRHAPFCGWIRDLAAPDPYYILPVLMGATLFFIQRMTPIATVDPVQQKVMGFMPILFTFFFLWLPSGLVLYYLISNLVTILQQWMAKRTAS